MSDALRRPLLEDRIDWLDRVNGLWVAQPHHGIDRQEDKFGDLVSLAEVDRLLMTGLLRRPFVRMFLEERELPFTEFGDADTLAGEEVTGAVDPRRIVALVRMGATVSLTGAHRWHVPIGRFSMALSETLGHPVQANVYVTPPQQPGLRLHYDTHDVVVFQVSGTKCWEVYDPVVEAPLPSQPWSARPEANEAGWAPPGRPRWQGELHPGAALFVPRGWLHRASTGDQPSLHLTIGILARTYWHVLEEMIRVAGRSPAVRSMVDFSVPDEVLVDEVVDLVGSLGDDFWRQAAGMGVVSQSIRNERYAPHFEGALTAAVNAGPLNDDSRVGRAPGTVRVVERGRARLLVGPTGCVSPGAGELAAWDLVASREEWSVGSLAEAGLVQEARMSFVHRLLEAGIVVSRPRRSAGSR